VAWKGVFGELELIPNSQQIYNTYLNWLNTIEVSPISNKFKGFLMSGWSRYNHMHGVCELFTAGLPTLVLALQTIINYEQDQTTIYSNTKALSGCNYNKTETGFILDLAPLVFTSFKASAAHNLYECDMPGKNLFKWIFNLKTTTQYYEKKWASYDLMLNDYNLEYKFYDKVIFDQVLNDFLPDVRKELILLAQEGVDKFDTFYYSDLFDEMKNIYIMRHVKAIDSAINRLKNVPSNPTAQVRPFNKIEINNIHLN
jgi:hypothetical protein